MGLEELNVDKFSQWPEKYNSAGHLTWRGRLYSKGITQIVDPKDPNIKYASFALPEMPRARRIMELYSY